MVPTYWLDHRVGTNLQFVGEKKNTHTHTISVKHSKAASTKMRAPCETLKSFIRSSSMYNKMVFGLAAFSFSLL